MHSASSKCNGEQLLLQYSTFEFPDLMSSNDQFDGTVQLSSKVTFEHIQNMSRMHAIPDASRICMAVN